MVKPVVSAGNAWTCIVLSVFAIIILSTIGALFKSGSQTLLGSDEDPEDGNAVAGAVFGAVFIYIVCWKSQRVKCVRLLMKDRASSFSVACRPCCTFARAVAARSACLSRLLYTTKRSIASGSDQVYYTDSQRTTVDVTILGGTVRVGRTRWFAFYNTAYGVERDGLFDSGFQVHVQLTRHSVNNRT